MKTVEIAEWLLRDMVYRRVNEYESYVDEVVELLVETINFRWRIK